MNASRQEYREARRLVRDSRLGRVGYRLIPNHVLARSMQLLMQGCDALAFRAWALADVPRTGIYQAFLKAELQAKYKR